MNSSDAIKVNEGLEAEIQRRKAAKELIQQQAEETRLASIRAMTARREAEEATAAAAAAATVPTPQPATPTPPKADAPMVGPGREGHVWGLRGL
jgi:hypothetical protein